MNFELLKMLTGIVHRIIFPRCEAITIIVLYFNCKNVYVTFIGLLSPRIYSDYEYIHNESSELNVLLTVL